MVPAVEMKDRRFGKVVVTGRAGSTTRGQLAVWNCRCDCGTEFTRTGAEIRRAGDDCSCAKCGWRRISEGLTTHGETGTYLHTAWMNARRRATDDKHPRWMDYGGRGINMHEDWLDHYEAYRDYILITLGPRPSEDHTIDRADNNKGYVPGNLRWATTEEQLANRHRC